jgi:drug/metabolite transporter (DMT)-like permease
MNSQECVDTKPAAPARRHKRGLATYLCLSWFLAFRAFGNLSLAWGARHFPEGLAINPFTYLRAMLNPFIAVGILLLIGGMLSRMALLSLADLSFVLPMTSVGYVISVVFGRLFLHESVSPERWLGVLLIFVAAILVGSTSNNTVKVRQPILPQMPCEVTEASTARD